MYILRTCASCFRVLKCTGHVLVAQLDRALDSDSKGRWFESSRVHYKKATLFKGGFFVMISIPEGMGDVSCRYDICFAEDIRIA